MKSAIFYGIIIIVIAQMFYWTSKNDEKIAKHWEVRQSQCRSLGSNWDLNNKGKCVEFDQQ